MSVNKKNSRLYLHQTHHTIGDFEGIFKTLTSALESSAGQYSGPQLHVFPELFLTGYPLQDLCLWPDFIAQYQVLLERLSHWAQKSCPLPAGSAVLLGGLEYAWDQEEAQGPALELPRHIHNGILLLEPSKALTPLYAKRLLPSYDIFDEAKYFRAGKAPGLWEWQGLKIGLLVCEDMWVSSLHGEDPVRDLALACGQKGTSLDLVVNLSASPFYVAKAQARQERASEISRLFKAPFAYCNRVGGEDEILFDGHSFITGEDGEIEFEAPRFAAGVLEKDLTPSVRHLPQLLQDRAPRLPENTWESLFKARLDYAARPVGLAAMSDADCAEALEALIFGLQEYAKKTGHSRFSVALSGGMDSGLVLTIAKLALGAKASAALEAVYMPGLYSAELSYELSRRLCQNLGTPLYTYPIKFLHSIVRTSVQENFRTPLQGLADENIQSRLRGALIYMRSNQTGSLVINTSNKSEIAVGYSTQYGDSVGAISLLGDLYKSEVFALARYINRTHEYPIPEEMITRPPSAELREGQRDDQSLAPYDRLDPILEGLLSYRHDRQGMIALGHDPGEVQRTYDLLMRSEYKRAQFCPIIKIRPKSFGFGHRVPICKRTP